eukprot:TRINITY_DN1959_c0_g1_i1.p1 TRINITY_DN1959_c0_g1~~TRINITY_DN1959_c0_g1_i1.p1  ORF type:complete len:260 (+),score=53.00 TRINITY_DN1959_c0_g1_i1:106-780(+)
MADVKGLRYLSFVRFSVLKVLAFLEYFYSSAKQLSGPLKPGLDAVEGTVKVVLNPVLDKVGSKPDEVLQAADDKLVYLVEFTTSTAPALKQKLDSVVDSLKKHTQRVSQVATVVVEDVSKSINDKGVLQSAKTYYNQYEPVITEYSHGAFRFFLALPLMAQFVQLIAPSAFAFLERYNSLLCSLKSSATSCVSKKIAATLPLIPVEALKQSVDADLSVVNKKNN